jgi:hypothetical protein
VFQNRALRRLFEPKRGEIIGGRELHNEELHKLYTLPSIISIIKSRRVRLAGNVACSGRKGMLIGFGVKSQKERDYLGDL